MSSEFHRFMVETFGDEAFGLYKHRTNAGDFIGWKYVLDLPNTKRPNPIEIIEFSDGLYYCGICAWINRETMQNILLALKKGLEKENNDE